MPTRIAWIAGSALGKWWGFSNYHQLHSNGASGVPEVDKVCLEEIGAVVMPHIGKRPEMRLLGINAVSGEVGRDCSF
jgi:hypothetical protein